MHLEDNEPGEMTLTFGFHDKLLHPIGIDIPLAFVSREARQTCLPWIENERMEVRFCKEIKRPVFARPINTARDVVYLHNINDFSRYPNDIVYPPDVEDRDLDIYFMPLRLAIPETVLQTEEQLKFLPDLFDWFSVIVLFIVIDSPPDLHLEDHKDLQQWWQLKDSGGDALVWEPARRCFDLRYGKISGQDNVSRHKEQINQLLGTKLSRNKHLTFDICPVLAGRKLD